MTKCPKCKIGTLVLRGKSVSEEGEEHWTTIECDHCGYECG